MSTYYIASCLFTAQFPKLSLRILQYMQSQQDIKIVRCCIPNYRVEFNTNRILDTEVQDAWKELPVSVEFQKEDTIISVCHNCTNIVEEWRGAKVISLWEYIDSDSYFSFPKYDEVMTIQDCWRVKERRIEQDAVRHLLDKMHITYLEIENNYDKTDFCGSTLYRSQPLKNARLAPQHYVENAGDYFKEYSQEKQIEFMKEYCSQYQSEKVVCYCHYCLEGLIQGGKEGIHIAELLFGDKQ